MAALPYMQLYVADYLADTMHLTTEEHGAYLLLIMNYWQTGKPIPKNRLSKIARMDNDRWTTVEVSLIEFFNDTGTEWVHDRIERDLEAVKDAQEQRVRAGRASAEARKRSKQEGNKRKGNDRSTTVDDSLQRDGNEKPTNKDTDTDTDTEGKKQKNTKTPAAAIDYSSWPDSPSEQVFNDWLAARRKAKATHSQTAMNQIGKELRKAAAMGISVDECLAEAATRGWRGFKAEWLQNEKHQRNGRSSIPTFTTDPDDTSWAEGFNPNSGDLENL